ncbi:ATP-binding protein involved in chromosome partitioning [Litorimonas taeanensis]|uniref:Iron-sulfur cluster carrier protein n=1 Tax=Litorimonas taeanensis TaxID=568099 RepID=A0A420WDE8_9PROT|nr:Mrp/NBP35 family ATP-binding protein [Litorimonas taeanensis]RKQ69013.1 ATP-binding protein involved in chromosome partitioning [Litorimonas taeanensis]
MAYSESEALRALKGLSDPLTGKDLVTAGLLNALQFENGVVRAVLQIDPSHADKYEALQRATQKALASVNGVETASVILSAHKSAPKVGGRKRPQPHAARRPEGYQGDSKVARVIAVSSAKGGVGKSTMAVNLAVALAKSGQKIGLLDADIHGPSVPMLLGLAGERAKTEEVEGRRLISPKIAFGLKAMSIGFLTDDDGPVVWRGPMVQGAISRMIWDVNWGTLDTLIIDMPPGTGDAQLGLAQDIKPAGAIIVSTPQDLALLDARKGVRMFEKVGIPVLGLIENMAVFTCPDCGSQHHIFGTGGAKRDAEKLGISYIGAAPLTLPIRESGDAGKPIAQGNSEEAKIFDALAKAAFN